jgi:hypothetical protein
MSTGPPQPAELARAAVPVYNDRGAGLCIYLCERCGQPLGGPHQLCRSALHVGPDGRDVGHAIASTELARLARAARAALGRP